MSVVMDSDHTDSVSEEDSLSGSESRFRRKRSGRSGVALDAFDKLLAKFRYSLNQCFCRGQDNLTIDELGEKFETLNELRTTLLPSIKSQITTFPTVLRSIGISDSHVELEALSRTSP